MSCRSSCAFLPAADAPVPLFADQSDERDVCSTRRRTSHFNFVANLLHIAFHLGQTCVKVWTMVGESLQQLLVKMEEMPACRHPSDKCSHSIRGTVGFPSWNHPLTWEW
eukprot:1554587-Amphidinium_carterae.1